MIDSARWKLITGWVAMAAVGLAVPAAAVVDPGGQAATPVSRVEIDARNTLRLEIPAPVPLADVVREIGAAIGAEVVVRRDPGAVGPLRMDGSPVAKALMRLVGRHSLVLRYDDGNRIAAIILIGEDGLPAASEPGVPSARQPGALPLPVVTPEHAARNRRAAAVRDIVKLSYRKDDAALAELQELFLTSDDPAVRSAAAGALAGTGRIEIEWLVDRALSDPDPAVRLRAAEGVWVAHGADAAERLWVVGRDDPSAEVRAGIAQLLEPGGEPKAYETGPGEALPVDR